MARSFSVGQWVSDNTAIAAGAILSGIFVLVGGAGCLAFLPSLWDWQASATWPTAPAEITESRMASSMQGRTVRPGFAFRYEWQGRAYTTRGFDLLEVYTNDRAGARRILEQHPVGSPSSAERSWF